MSPWATAPPFTGIEGRKAALQQARQVIEFRSQAARAATRLKRELTVPVASPAAKLRLRVAGVGQAAFSHVMLTNGVELLFLPGRFRLPKTKTILGSPAPKQGMPNPTALENGRAWLLDFAPPGGR